MQFALRPSELFGFDQEGTDAARLGHADLVMGDERHLRREAGPGLNGG